GRVWLHRPGDLSDGRMVYPGRTPAELAAFFQTVAAADAALDLSYLGVWDRHGAPVYAGDLLVYHDEPPTGTVEVLQNPPVLGLARYDEPDPAHRAADFVPRRHADVHQLTEARMAVLLETDGRGHTRRFERWTRSVRFYRDEHGYDGGEVLWPRIAAPGNPVEQPAPLHALPRPRGAHG